MTASCRYSRLPLKPSRSVDVDDASHLGLAFANSVDSAATATQIVWRRQR